MNGQDQSAEISVVIADDNADVRKALVGVLTDSSTITVVGEAECGRRAIELVSELRPKVITLDVAMPEIGGIEAAHHITKNFAQTNILAVSMHTSPQFVREMLSAGALGYLLKDDVHSSLKTAIETVAAGEFYLSSQFQYLLP